jgi:hypothetical protein
MKKYALLFSVIFSILFSQAQYCGNSGSSRCTPAGTLTHPGVAPASSQIAPLQNGVPVNTFLELKSMDTISPVFTVILDSLHIDSIVNLPHGLCWATNKPGNTFLTNEDGCIVLEGQPCDLPGEYHIQIYGIQYTTFSIFGDSINGPLGPAYDFFLRLDNPGDAARPVDTNQTAAFVSYSEVPACSGIPYFVPTRVSADSVCEGTEITITIATNVPFDTSNYFSAYLQGDGFWLRSASTDSVKAHQSGTYTFTLPTDLFNFSYGGTWFKYPIALVSTDSAMNFVFDTLSVFPVPDITYLGDQYYMCPGGLVTIAPSVNIGAQTFQAYEWQTWPQDSAVGTTSVITLTPTQTTTYDLFTIIPPYQCWIDTHFTVTVYPVPSAGTMNPRYFICSGDSVTIGPDTVNINFGYSWSGGITSTLANPIVSPTTTEVYTLSVMDFTTGCMSSAQSVEVFVNTPPAQQLCMVTVDSTSSYNIVVWEKLDKGATDSFFVYREITTNNYSRVGAIPKDSLSVFVDYGSNPNITSYRYKISVKDTCGFEGDLSDYHNTIHLQSLGGGNLLWNLYDIEGGTIPVSSYDVYKDSLGNGSYSLMISIPGTQTSATDLFAALTPNAKYRVVANWNSTCTPTRSFDAAFSNVLIGALTATTELDNDAVRIFPNPASAAVRIESSVSFENVRVSDITGNFAEVPCTKQNNSWLLNIEHLPRGTYYVQLQSEGKLYRTRFTKL